MSVSLSSKDREENLEEVKGEACIQGFLSVKSRGLQESDLGKVTKVWGTFVLFLGRYTMGGRALSTGEEIVKGSRGGGMEASEDDSCHSVLSARKSCSRLDSPRHAGTGHIIPQVLALNQRMFSPLKDV